MAIKNEFSEYLLFYKQYHSLTVQQLADKIGVPKRTLECWLDCSNNPRKFTITAVKEKLKKEENKI